MSEIHKTYEEQLSNNPDKDEIKGYSRKEMNETYKSDELNYKLFDL